MKIIDRTSGRRIALSWHIRCCLRWIPATDLFGIDQLTLEDRIGPPTAHSSEWHRQAYREEHDVIGQYFGKQNEVPASITLYIATLYDGVPWMYWLSPMITLNIARTLAHEVGHHLIAKQGYVFDEREKINEPEYAEEMANRYSFSITKRMKKRWYYRFADWLARDLAGWHYIHGIFEWRAGRYDSAAASWKNAYNLDPNHSEAAYWYHRAKEAQSADPANVI